MDEFDSSFPDCLLGGDLYKIKNSLKFYKFSSYKEYKDELNKALVFASGKGDIRLFRYLITLGANLSVYGQKCISLACQNNHIDIVKLLIEQGSDVDLIFSEAFFKNNLEIAGLAINYGANIHLFSLEFIKIASYENKIDFLNLFIVNFNDGFKLDKYQVSLIHSVIKEGHVHIIDNFQSISGPRHLPVRNVYQNNAKKIVFI